MEDWGSAGKFVFTAPLSQGGEASHDVRVDGRGPPILILQELPGIGPETLDLADRLVAAGFRVYLPHLFGKFGQVTTLRNAARLFCVRREINVFLRGRESPIAGWLRALCREIRRREGGERRVGVIGMCLTGGFALTLMAEDAVAGGVAAQPALPLFSRGALPMSADDIAAARRGMARNGPGLAMRHLGDPIAPAALMRALEAAFGDDLVTVAYPGRRHSLLTLDFHEPAYRRVEAYFHERFRPAS